MAHLCSVPSYKQMHPSPPPKKKELSSYICFLLIAVWLKSRASGFLGVAAVPTRTGCVYESSLDLFAGLAHFYQVTEP